MVETEPDTHKDLVCYLYLKFEVWITVSLQSLYDTLNTATFAVEEKFCQLLYNRKMCKPLKKKEPHNSINSRVLYIILGLFIFFKVQAARK